MVIQQASVKPASTRHETRKGLNAFTLCVGSAVEFLVVADRKVEHKHPASTNLASLIALHYRSQLAAELLLT